MEDIGLYCDNIITMADGKVLLEGTPREVFSHHEELVDNGLAIPQVTEILSKLKKDGYNVNDSCYTVNDAAQELRKLFEKNH